MLHQCQKCHPLGVKILAKMTKLMKAMTVISMNMQRYTQSLDKGCSCHQRAKICICCWRVKTARHSVIGSGNKFSAVACTMSMGINARSGLNSGDRLQYSYACIKALLKSATEHFDFSLASRLLRVSLPLSLDLP